MNTALEDYLRRHTSLSDDEMARIVALAVPRALQRNEFLLQEGQVCRHKIFISKGLLRTFGTAADGSDHVLQFSPENSWALDVESYDKQIPATTKIAAVERTEVVIWTKNDFNFLLDAIPAMKAHS